MRKSLTLAAVAATLTTALAASTALAEPVSRYALDVSVYRDGVAIVSAQTVIAEDSTANIHIDGAESFNLSAQLNTVQGDGDDAKLELSASLQNGDDTPLEPRLTLKRGGTARMEVGEGNGAGIINGTTLTLSPLQPEKPAAQ